MTTAGERQRGSWETVTAALEGAVGPGRSSGSWVKYNCPAHEADGRGHHPSLGVKYSDDEHRTVVRCFAGCDNEQVLHSVGLRVRDMFDRDLPRTERGRARAPRPRQVSRAERAVDAAGLPLVNKKPDLGRQIAPWKVADTYDYVRADGTVAGRVIRREAAFERGRDKKFTQQRWDTERGEFVDEGFEHIPYNLPEVLAAIADGIPVYLVEGEKDVESARRAGLVATTNAGGASSWTEEHARYLTGAKLLVCVVDVDAPGYRRGERVRTLTEPLVGRLRVVQAATGKDLSDHLGCGHEVSEMTPVPHLDPYTPTEPTMPGAQALPASASGPARAAAPALGTATPGGDLMPEHQMIPVLHDHAPDHTPDIDHAGQQFSMFARLLFQQMVLLAQHHVEQRRRRDEQARSDAEDELREYTARQAAERKAVETRLGNLRKAGFGTASRGEIAAAVRDAAAWAPDSAVAAQILDALTGHVHERYGVRIDAASGEVRADTPAELVAALQKLEAERAADARVRAAHDRMVNLIAQVKDVDESSRQALYAELEQWRTNPAPAQLERLSKTLETAGVDERTRLRLRFVAQYLGQPHHVVPVDELGHAAETRAVSALRRLDGPVVEPGDVVKPKVDQLLQGYQARLRHGMDVTEVTRQLAETVAVMTPEDQAIARARGSEIRANPAAEYRDVWGDYVDRDELAATVRMYAVLAPEAERQAVEHDSLDASAAVQLRDKAERTRKKILTAIRDGKGLDDIEREQLRCVLSDIEAGRCELPELLFADDRSAAVADADRADQIADDTARYNRRHLENLLDTHHVPGTKRVVADDVSKIVHGQVQLAAGRWTLADYEQRGFDEVLDTRLVAAGVSEPLRNQVRKGLAKAAEEAAIVGRQAQRTADRWSERTERVVESRRPQRPAYDSDERRAEFSASLADAGLSPDEIDQRMAADAGRANPPSTAANPQAGRGRRTQAGSGVRRTHHRGRGDQRGKGI